LKGSVNLIDKRIAVIGAGKVGSALALGLSRAGCAVTGVASRSPASAGRLAFLIGCRPCATLSDAAAGAEVLIIAVPDRAVGRVGRKLARSGAVRPGHVVIHTSGALPSGALDAVRGQGAAAASMHPVQSFARLDDVERLYGCYYGVEGDPKAVAAVREMVSLLGGRVLPLDGCDKALYHAAACVASNYLVVLLHLARTLIESAGVDAEQGRRALLRLAEGTLANAGEMDLPSALTGPIARGDTGTVARHARAMSGIVPEAARLYGHLGLYAVELARAGGGLDALRSIKMVNLLKGVTADDGFPGDHGVAAPDEAGRAADHDADGLRLPDGPHSRRGGH